MERKNGSWTIKDTKKKFANDFFTVFEDKVVQPDGNDGKYATIDLKDGVSVLPIDDDGFVYITKQFKYAVGRYSLEAIVGAIVGAIEDDEQPEKSARRERKKRV